MLVSAGALWQTPPASCPSAGLSQLNVFAEESSEETGGLCHGSFLFILWWEGSVFVGSILSAFIFGFGGLGEVLF
ncbi:MAG: hypothetical protein BTN85_0542 [Candidatus Methanohalarchaeum thermophilum]|uniref:Uncharacterized protein n=1 Tax=Methanohalarchaeum thermophilum TaxID=1903181 RepID=A0A1Q6DUP8_METT1|nr:MAG: hypothetical protein BTN85_0542 [Candidatus Methanohalarchaeum thermophilum]